MKTGFLRKQFLNIYKSQTDYRNRTRKTLNQGVTKSSSDQGISNKIKSIIELRVANHIALLGDMIKYERFKYSF